MNPDCNPIEQQARQDQLEALYEADGRHDPEHPMHCLYCGLVAGQEQEVGDADDNIAITSDDF